MKGRKRMMERSKGKSKKLRKKEDKIRKGFVLFSLRKVPIHILFSVLPV